MRILFVCHRFPFPPKRGGKIRPFNIIRHLAARQRGHGLLARPLERGGARGRGNRSVLRALRDGARPRAGAGAADGGAAADAGAVVDGLLLFGPARAPHPRAARGRTLRPRLRPLLVGRAVRQPTCAARPRSSTSATWIRRSGSSTLATSRSRFRSATGWRGASSSARSAASRAASTCARRRPVPSGKRWRATRAGGRPTGFRTASTASSLPRRPSPTIRTRFASSGAWITIRTRSACSTSARARCRCCGRGVRTLKLLIVGADPSPAVRKLGELPGVTVTGSVPDVRSYLHRSALMVAPLNIARGTQNKILEAMSAGVPVVTSAIAAGGVDALDREHFLVGSSPQEYAAAMLPGSSTIRQNAAGSRKPVARGCSRTTRGRTRCRSSMRSSSAASRSGPPETATASAGSRCQRGPAKQSANQVRCPAVTGTNQAKRDAHGRNENAVAGNGPRPQ